MRTYRYTGRRRRKGTAWMICLVAVVLLILAVLTVPAAGAVL